VPPPPPLTGRKHGESLAPDSPLLIGLLDPSIVLKYGSGSLFFMKESTKFQNKKVQNLIKFYDLLTI
jgi:hypothetical protein